MSSKKISCGGFAIDNETIVEEGGVLKTGGSGGAGGSLLIEAEVENPWNARSPESTTLDKTWDEISTAYNNNLPMAVRFVSSRYDDASSTPSAVLIAPCIGAGYSESGALNQINFGIVAMLSGDKIMHSIVVTKNIATYRTINW